MRAMLIKLSCVTNHVINMQMYYARYIVFLLVMSWAPHLFSSKTQFCSMKCVFLA
uniref:Uncharacterized protein n=1 Tax=Anguilla anguilla TaxID=7936 RepID=A0A0E9WDF8_ANGAN